MNSIFTPFPDTLWVRKEIKFGYSCSLCQILHSWYRQSSFLHSATPRARDGLSESLMQDLAEKALVPKLDSYNICTFWHMYFQPKNCILRIKLKIRSSPILYILQLASNAPMRETPQICGNTVCWNKLCYIRWAHCVSSSQHDHSIVIAIIVEDCISFWWVRCLCHIVMPMSDFGCLPLHT